MCVCVSVCLSVCLSVTALAATVSVYTKPDNIYVLSELVQGRLREGKKTYHVQKAMIRCGV